MPTNAGLRTQKFVVAGKRMKKRKELDALISDRPKSGGYEQLHKSSHHSSNFVSSSSRDVDTYFAPMRPYENMTSRHNRPITHHSKVGCTSKRAFHICLPACILALVAACVTSSIGIVWMQVQLKSDLDHIKDRVYKIERWKSDQPATLVDLQSVVSQLQRDIQQGSSDIQAIQSHLAEVNSKVEKQMPAETFAEVLPVLQEGLGSLQRDVNDITSQIARLRDSLQNVDSSQQEVDAQNDRISKELNALGDLVKANHQEWTTGNLPQRYATALERHDHAVNDTMEALRRRIETLEDQTDDVSALNQQITSLAEDQKATHDDVTRVGRRLKNLNSTLTVLVENDKELDNRVTAVERAAASPSDQNQQTIEESQAHKVAEESNKDTNLPARSQNADKSVSKSNNEHGSDRGTETAPSHNTSVRVGDTTTSFTELPIRKRHAPSHSKIVRSLRLKSGAPAVDERRPHHDSRDHATSQAGAQCVLDHPAVNLGTHQESDQKDQ